MYASQPTISPLRTRNYLPYSPTSKMSQTAILAAIASLKKQMTALENLVAGSTKNLAMLPPLPQSEAEGDAPAPAKPKAKKNLSPERLAYLKSDEHKAKLQAGLAAYRAKKAAEKAAGGGAAEPAEPAEKHDSSGAYDSGSATSHKRRGPKKLSEMTAEELEAHKVKVADNKAKRAAKKAEEAAAEE